MSYINMDHAGWVQLQIDALKPRASKSELRIARDDGRGWAAAPDQLTPFQKRAFDILGIVAGGIYNAPIAWKGVFWRPNSVAVSWHNGLATFDFTQLTTFVFLCHEARIRGEISPLSPRHLQITLHERSDHGGMAKRHPDLDEAFAGWRAIFPREHSIVYRAQPFPEPAESLDPAHAAAGGVLIPSMVAEQAGEQDAGETIAASASAVSSPALLAPAEPGGCKGGCGHAPEVNSSGEDGV